MTQKYSWLTGLHPATPSLPVVAAELTKMSAVYSWISAAMLRKTMGWRWSDKVFKNNLLGSLASGDWGIVSVCGWQTGCWLVCQGFILVSSWVLKRPLLWCFCTVFPQSNAGYSVGEVAAGNYRLFVQIPEIIATANKYFYDLLLSKTMINDLECNL